MEINMPSMVLEGLKSIIKDKYDVDSDKRTKKKKSKVCHEYFET